MPLDEVAELFVSEDVVRRPVFLAELKETFLVGRGGDDFSPRKASCRTNVLGNVSSVSNLGVVVAGVCLVRLKVVFFLFRPVAFTEVMAAGEEVGSGVADRLDISGTSSVIEDREGLLETGIETDDSVEVNALILVKLLNDLKPVPVRQRVEVVC